MDKREKWMDNRFEKKHREGFYNWMNKKIKMIINNGFKKFDIYVIWFLTYFIIYIVLES